ncbi:MAG: hypothetical protein IPG04_12550 [Polyangiaceae bacterium]|nr:hypothetical protein [Polyangiaceae bacterium]
MSYSSKHAVKPPSPEDVELAESIVDEILARFDQTVAPDMKPAYRELLVQGLLFTQEGRRRLRAARPDPTVARSADIPLEPAKPVRKVHRGGK